MCPSYDTIDYPSNNYKTLGLLIIIDNLQITLNVIHWENQNIWLNILSNKYILYYGP
jgi:hypothetical protein